MILHDLLHKLHHPSHQARTAGGYAQGSPDFAGNRVDTLRLRGGCCSTRGIDTSPSKSTGDPATGGPSIETGGGARPAGGREGGGEDGDDPTPPNPNPTAHPNSDPVTVTGGPLAGGDQSHLTITHQPHTLDPGHSPSANHSHWHGFTSGGHVHTDHSSSGGGGGFTSSSTGGGFGGGGGGFYRSDESDMLLENLGRIGWDGW